MKKLKVIFVLLLLFNFSAFCEEKLEFGPEKDFSSYPKVGLSTKAGTTSEEFHTLNFSITTDDIKWIKSGKADLIKIEGINFNTSDVGAPMIPFKVYAVNLPEEATVTGVDVVNIKYREILNSLYIMPVPRPTKITPEEEIEGKIELKIPLEKAEEEKSIKEENEGIYSKEGFYPENFIKWQTGKDGERCVVYVHFFPVYYNPVEKKSFVITSATIRVHYNTEKSSSSQQLKSTSLAGNDYDYELLIITPRIYRDLARKLQKLHNEDPVSPVRTCYVYLEDINRFYFPQSATPDHVDPGNPPYDAHPNNVYPDGDTGRTLARKIIRFLGEMAKQYIYAPYGLLHPRPASNLDVKFQYVLILGRADIVPPSWYPWYGVPPKPYWYTSYGWEATDFFYASPSAPAAGITYDLLPEYAVGRIPIVEEARDEEIFKVDIIDKTNLTITTNGTLPDNVRVGDLIKMVSGSTTYYPIYFEITDIEDNSPDNFILTIKETDVGLYSDESEENYFNYVNTGHTYQFYKNVLNNLYLKESKYMKEVTTSGVWQNWFRNVAVAGGATFGTSYYWGELAANQYINNGHFEGNRIVKKLFRTNEEDSDFDKSSISPFLNNTENTGLFYIGCHGSGTDFVVDNDMDNPSGVDKYRPAGYINSEDIKGYTSSDSKLPIVVSSSCLNGLFDSNIFNFNNTDRSLGEAIVNAFDESRNNGSSGIAYIGCSREGWSSVSAYFDKGVIHPFSDMLGATDQMLNFTCEYWHLTPHYIGDIFVRAIKGTNQTPEDCFLAQNDMGNDFNRYILFEYTLLGDPALPIPYPLFTPIITGTIVPDVEIDETSLREIGPKYESHDIPVDEIPSGGVATTIVKIIPDENNPGNVTANEIKIKKIDAMEVPGRTWYEYPAPDFSYRFTTGENTPGYYIVAVTQRGWDPITNTWGDWWEKENRIYIQEVNEFVPKTDNILLVDDDYGFPFYLREYPYYEYPYRKSDGYEDFYQQSLINLGENYDLWNVDFDDTEDYSWTTGDYNGNDDGYTRMYGEIYPEILDKYKKIIWETGNQYNRFNRNYGILGDTLTSPDRNFLSQYLDEGGKLFLSGQDILWDLGVNSFVYNYLKVSNFQASYGYGGKYSVDGIDGDLISSGLHNINIAGGNGANNQYIFNVISPTSDGNITFIYNVPSGGSPSGINPPYYAGVYGLTGNNGGTVFLPWGLESIDRQDYRDEVLERVLAWMESPSTPTGSITAIPGDKQVTLNWTAPPSAAGVLILYSTTNYPTGTPTNGQTYNQGQTIGDGTVAYVGGGTTSYIHTGLTNGTTYYYVVYWYDGSKNYTKMGSTAATPTGATEPTGSFNATGGDAQITLDWTLPSGASGILILCSAINYPTGKPTDGQTYSQGNTISGGTGGIDGIVVYVGGGTSYVHSGLPNGITYYYIAYYYDSSHKYTELGRDNATTLATGAVFTATAGDGQVLLNWTIPGGKTGVLITYSKTDYPVKWPTDGKQYKPGDSTGDGEVVYSGSETSYTHTGLTNGQTYYYVAYSYTGTFVYAYLGQASATPTEVGPGPDGDPTDLTATPGKNKIYLSWKDNSRNELGFIIERKSPTEGYKQIKAVRTGTTTYIDLNLIAGITYTYRVCAFNKGGYSGYSNEASATPYAFSPDEAPEIVSAKRILVPPKLDINITIQWIDNSIDEDGFEIWRKDGDTGDYRKIGEVGSDITIFVDTDASLYGGRKYFYKVRAYNDSNYSEFSLPVSITPSAFPDGQDPTNLRATPGINSVALQWVDNANFETGLYHYEIEIAYSPNFNDMVRVDSCAGRVGKGPRPITYTAGNLPGGWTYYFRVRGWRSEGYSNYANLEDNKNLYYAEAISYTTYDSGDGGGGGGCFIATATYGTPLAKEVQILCKWRDEYLLKNWFGRKAVKFYYKISPPIASFIRENTWAKSITRALLTPIIYVVKIKLAIPIIFNFLILFLPLVVAYCLVKFSHDENTGNLRS